MENCIEGKNAVMEALRAGRQIEKVLVAENGDNTGFQCANIVAEAKKNGITIQFVPKKKLDDISETKKHQGVIAITAVISYAELEDVLEAAREKAEPPFIVVLDHIEDPHNLGAIIRTAEAAGAHGVIIPKRRAAAVTPIVEKAAAGAVSHIPIARVANIAACIERLKKDGIWVYCASAEGKDAFRQDLKGAVAVVIGAEGGGVSRLVMEKCDFCVSVPMRGKISSLNASVAAGVLLYEVVRQRML